MRSEKLVKKVLLAMTLGGLLAVVFYFIVEAIAPDAGNNWKSFFSVACAVSVALLVVNKVFSMKEKDKPSQGPDKYEIDQ